MKNVTCSPKAAAAVTVVERANNSSLRDGVLIMPFKCHRLQLKPAFVSAVVVVVVLVVVVVVVVVVLAVVVVVLAVVVVVVVVCCHRTASDPSRSD